MAFHSGSTEASIAPPSRGGATKVTPPFFWPSGVQSYEEADPDWGKHPLSAPRPSG
jgi:hypothetical protein